MVDVYLGIGSNVDPDNNIAKVADILQDEYPSIVFSRTFESEAIGFKGNNFHNLVAMFAFHLEQQSATNAIVNLGSKLKDIEKQLGRLAGGKKFSPRTMDIDILLFGDLVVSKPIILPREEILKNAYVLWPLSELAPTLNHPGLDKNYQELWQAFDKSSQNLHPL